MNIGKFILNVVVAYILYAILYTIAEMYIIADQMAAMRDLMKPEEETMIVFFYYLVETIVFVWLFTKVVASNDMKAASVYGVMMGLYISAMGATMTDTLKMMPEGITMPATIMNLVISVIVSAALAFMWGKGWGAGATDAGAEGS